MTLQHNSPEYTVSEISGQLKRMVEETFGYVRVRGEISKASVNQASGHCYLSLKDDKAVLDAVIWKGVMGRLKHKPQAGLEVIATGKLTTYPGSSKYQLVIEAMEPAGVGALMAMLEARKKALEAEGLFDVKRKKPLPYLPECIGIITSPTGAVIRDILHRLADRFPRHVLLWPVAVQGQGAAEQVARAIEGFNRLESRIESRESSDGGGACSHSPLAGESKSPDSVFPVAAAVEKGISVGASGLGRDLSAASLPNPSPAEGEGTTEQVVPLRPPDLIIVARGGGSIEDLWAFNEEVVVRAVAASRIPIISAVGHETDTTLIDYVADRRAPTPTAAAEMAVPVREELRSFLENQGLRITQLLRTKLVHCADRIAGLARGLPQPQQLVATMEQSLDRLSERLDGVLPRFMALKNERLAALTERLTPRLVGLSVERLESRLTAITQRFSPRLIATVTERMEAKLVRLADMLESLNVLAVLKRGFAIVKTAEGLVVPSAHQMPQGAALRIQFHDGERRVISEGKKSQGDLFSTL